MTRRKIQINKNGITEEYMTSCNLDSVGLLTIQVKGTTVTYNQSDLGYFAIHKHESSIIFLPNGEFVKILNKDLLNLYYDLKDRSNKKKSYAKKCKGYSELRFN